MQLNLLDRVGDWNPQLFREIKGRLKPRTKRRRSLAVDRLSLGCAQIRIGNACCSGTLRAVEYPGLVELAINTAVATDWRVRIPSPVYWSSQDFTTKGESLMTHPWINLLSTSLNELEQSCCFFSYPLILLFFGRLGGFA
jgi:hypothetical protein